ncbi:SH3 and cysteine-rich domain-containing protein isoform X2 [Amblyomma americanum]
MSSAAALTRYLKRNSRRLSRESSRESSLLSEYDDQIRSFVKIVADFTQQLSNLHSHHAEELQLLVEAFRKRNSELRKERPPYHSSLFNCWEVLLQEVEVDSQVHGDISRCLGQHMGVMLLEKTFHRKAQSRKVFLHRESFETILVKAEELLNKCQGEYAEAYRAVCRRGCPDLTAAPLDQKSPLTASEEQAALAAYYDCHNAYVQQLAATNGMLEEYYNSTLPRLLDELQDVYCDVSTIVAQSMMAASEVLAAKAREQAEHYEAVGASCRAVNARSDLAGFVRTLCSSDPRNPAAAVLPATPPRHPFVPPRSDTESVSSGDSQLQQPTLGEQVVVDRLASLSVSSRSESLRQDVAQLEVQVRQLQDTLDALLRMQQRSLESSLYNKANELQEDISMKRFDLHVAQIHLAAVKAQFALFRGKEVEADGEERNCRERKASTAVPAVTGTIKNKWLKAFRSLKTGSGGASDKPDGSDRKGSHAAGGAGGAGVSWDTGQHVFQEYTYKKVAACDVCREILRGHVRQGLKCKLCKYNVHAECQEKAGRCQPKPRLLRRQRSASEIETKIIPAEPEEEKTPSATPDAVDPIYQLLKQAGDLGGSSRRGGGGGEGALSRLAADRVGDGGGGSSSVSSSVASLQQRRPRSNASSSASSSSSHMLTVSSHQHHPSSSARWRQIVSAPHSPQRKKLSLRMKSLSLDSPESNEHAHRRRQLTAPQSPVHGRRQLLSAKAVRMSSVDLPDDNEKSLSSASTSPCPSPKPHRLLPTNIYVVLYNFRSRHQDELDLKAGDTVTVIDTTDPDWWQGKCLGRVGFFPSKYVAKLHSGERALQVLHSIQVMDGQEPVKLLRDQIVIQVADEMDGKVLVRTGMGDKALPCPLKYLQEV